MSALNPREAYRRWAPSYERETAITHLEDGLVSAMTPRLDGKRLLDVGCGTGRRLLGTRAAEALGIELSPEMIEAGASLGPWPPEVRFLQGDVLALPPVCESFDVIWCRLVLGHVAPLRRAYAGLARAAAAGGTVIVTDFHPRAYEAGHRRTFRDADGVHEIEHHVHDIYAHREAAITAGLELIEVREGVIGPRVRDFYEEAGRLAQYQAELGLAIVLALGFRKAW